MIKKRHIITVLLCGIVISVSSVLALTIDTVNDQFYVFGDNTTAIPILCLNWTGNETYIVPYNETLYYVNETGVWFDLTDVGAGGGGNPFNQDLNTTDDVTFNTVVASNLNIANWNTAYGWGDHSTQNYLDLDTYPNTDTDATNDILDSDFVSAGLMKTDGAGGYSVITDNSANWNTAYGWGDHSTQNYFDKDIDILQNITDVNSSDPETGDILKYNKTSFMWELERDETGGGNPFNQDLNTTDAVTFVTVNTGEGANELFDMDQDVTTGDEVTFEGLTVEDSADSVTPEIRIGVPNNGVGAVYWDDEADSEYFRYFFQEAGLAGGKLILESTYSSVTYPTIISLQQNGYTGFNDLLPAYRVELPNIATTSGRGRANQWATYSDERLKEAWNTIPKAKTISVLENLTYYLYYWKDYYFDEINETLIIGDTNTSKVGIGLFAQETYNFLKDEFGENWAGVIVHKPANENISEWSVDYDSLQVLNMVGAQVLIQQVKELNNKVEKIDGFLSQMFGGVYDNFV